MRVLGLIAIIGGCGSLSQAFIPAAPLSVSSAKPFSRQHTIQMGLFDSIKKGFENEVQATPAQNAGLKNAPTTVKITFQPSGKVVEAVAGQNLKDVAAAARIPIKYNCRKGECGTCTVTLNGRKIKTCVSIVPRGERKNEVIMMVP